MKVSQSKLDPRWATLSLVQTARERLGLKGRSLTVLRGLMSFITPKNWIAGQLHTFPSNRALQERCDGMDERTLRRHIGHLCAAGLIERKLSPNRKRYIVRDENGAAILCYGFDLSPLRHHLEHLEMMASDVNQEARKVRALKAVLRDLLWHLPESSPELHKLLRNKCSIETLENTIELLRTTAVLTDSHGHSDRHIQNKKKEYIEEDKPMDATTSVSPQECIEAAGDAVAFATGQVESWQDLHEVAHQLAPAIGIKAEQAHETKKTMGVTGFTLAILGLTQSHSRVKNIPAYLERLCQAAQDQKLNLDRMFRSLVRKQRFPAGNFGSNAA